MGHHASWLERAIDVFKPQPGSPPKPHAPHVDQSAWNQSVEQKHVIPGLTVRQVGLSVFGETRSLHDRPGSNEPIGAARQRVAHAMINDAELSHRTVKPRNAVHAPVEPSGKALRNPEERAAYESSMHAAREAYLSGHDPTNGATNFRLHPTPNRSNWKFPKGTPEGLTLSTQSGPNDNSFLGDVKSHTAWVDTYLPGRDEKEPKTRKRRYGAGPVGWPWLLIHKNLPGGLDADSLHLPLLLRFKRTNFKVGKNIGREELRFHGKRHLRILLPAPRVAVNAI